MKQSTPLTRVLQVWLPVYFGFEYLSTTIREWASPGSQGRLSWIPTIVFFFIVNALLTVGAFKRWTWAFWTYVVWLALRLIFEVVSVLEGDLVSFSWILGMVPVVFGACLYSRIRYGPWAQTKASLPPGRETDKNRPSQINS